MVPLEFQRWEPDWQGRGSQSLFVKLPALGLTDFHTALLFVQALVLKIHLNGHTYINMCDFLFFYVLY